MCNDTLVHEEDYRDHRIEIHTDLNPMSPREWDNLGTMVLDHRRYNLPNEIDLDFDSCQDWSEVHHDLISQHGADVILPVYMLDHSGLSLSTISFNDPWDSGQIGFIYCTRKDLQENFITEEISDEQYKLALDCLRGEVDTYGQYINGEVYGYIIYRNDQEVDACWGFYGDYALDEAKGIIDGILDGAG
jgi:hypothetical protein